MTEPHKKPWYHIRSEYILALIIGIFVLVTIFGCTPEARPFKTGVEVPPPAGCAELRTRGGEC